MKNIYQRVNEVMKEVAYVQKDASVSTGKGSYRAVTHDMVLAVLRKSMVEHGIVTRTELVKGKIVQLKDFSKDIKQNFYAARYRVDFVNIDDPQDFMSCVFDAHANDSGDKAPGKTASMAIKYAMLKTFGLETGENEESRTHQPDAYTELQKQEFDEYIERNENGLGFVCFQATVGDEVMTALNGSFEKGKISSGKETIRKLTREGYAVLNNAVAQIQEAINNNDPDGLLEVVSEFESPAERKLLGGLLSASEIKAIKDVKDLAK